MVIVPGSKPPNNVFTKEQGDVLLRDDVAVVELP
jgi:hypothetical protein